MTSPELIEREVDLARWRRAVVTLWWLPVGGLVLGAIVGVLYSLSGGSNYKATAFVSLGQATSPGGALVQSYSTNPRAITAIVNSASAEAEAAAQARMHASALRGHIAVAQVGAATQTGVGRATPLISVTVNGAHRIPVEDAANALAKIVVQKTTAPYVDLKIRTFDRTLRNVNRQLASVNQRIAAIAQAEKASKHLDPLQQLVVVSQEDNAETRLGNLLQQQETLQLQKTFALQVESASVVTKARSVKASAHSRNTSLIVGAVIGLILGLIVAIAGESRFRRPVAD